jgi:hypothetical protein
VTGWQTAYPQVADGIMVVRVAEGYIAEGGPRREMFTGRVAREVFPRLLPLLDGTKLVAEIAADLDYAPASVWRLVELLSQRGLVQVLTQPVTENDRSSLMRVFLHRSVPGGRGPAVTERLRRAEVCVVGDTPVANAVADLLERSGIGSVRRDRGWRSQAPGAGTPDLVVWTAAAARAESGSHRPAGPWLLVRAGTDRISVGPLLGAPGGACPQCSTGSGSESSLGGGPHMAAADAAALTGLGAGVAAGAALRYLGGYGTSGTWHGIIEVWRDGRQVERTLGAQPQCPSCRPTGLSLTDRELSELTYERSVEPPPWGGEMRSAESAHRHPVLPKPYLTEQRLRARCGGNGASDDSLLPALAWLLTRSVGARTVRNSQAAPGRPGWTPTVGPLGSINAYVLGDLDGAGWGIHYFDTSSREFVTLPGRGRPDSPAPGGALSVVLTGDVPLVRSVFGSAARRVIYQDAGLAVAQLDACARLSGWRIAARQDGAQCPDEMLELAPGREIVAAVIDLVCDPAARRPWTGSPPAGLSARLRRPLTYLFRDEPVTTEVVRQTGGAGLAGAEAIWREPNARPALSCVVYARHVASMTRGLYVLGAEGADLVPLGEPGKSDEGTSLAESYLRDRALDPPALLLFAGDLPGTLATCGAPGYPALVVAAATAAGLTRLEAIGAGLGAGLFARLPASGWLVSPDDPRAGRRVFCGCAIGHVPSQSPSPEPRCVPW